MELKLFLEIISRRKRVILAAFVLVAGTAWVGSALLPDFFEATAKFTIRNGSDFSQLARTGGQGANIAGAGGGVSSSENDLPTRVIAATTEPILKAVMQKLQLRDHTGNFWPPARLKQLAMLSGRPSLRVQRVSGTELLRVRARSRDPDEAVMIVNTLAEVYTDQNRQERKEEYRQAMEFVTGKIKTAKNEFLQILTEIKDFKIAENVVDLGLETERALDRMSELLMMKENAVISLAESRAKLTIVRLQLANRGVMGVSTPAISENPQIELLKGNLSQMEVQLAGLLAEKKPGHPDVTVLNRKIEILRRQLESEVRTFSGTAADLQALERNIAAQEAGLKNLNDETSRITIEMAQFPRKAIADSQLQLRYTSTRELYNSLLDSLNQIGVAEAMALSDIKLVEPGNLQRRDKSEWPKRGLMRIMGIFLGVVFGLTLGFLVDHLDDTIKTPEEIRQAGIPLLGTIPKFRQKPTSLIHKLDPRNPVCEAYRMVRRSVRLAGVDKPVQILLVTSPMAGEGKTTTVANLGISIAREGKQVLLMDTDLRQSALHTLFGLSNAQGLNGVLADNPDVGAAIQKTSIEGLSVLPSGPLLPDPGLLIESEKLKQLLQTLRAQYDVVIMDSAPTLAVGDAVVLAGIADASVSVLESGKETRQALAMEREHFSREGVKLLGVMLNKFGSTGFQYHAYGYDYPSDRAQGGK